ncbi:hypothetical protein Patl1_36934 [Pistacia atlantica]|nr:hypothetical protein Patl1_36934 [Pistacia atlantica]
MVLIKESPGFIPLWIKFFNLLMECWSHEALNFITSGVGKPLSLDKITEDTCNRGVRRIGFAHSLIEVDASCKLPKVVRVYILVEKSGKLLIMDIRVE